MKDQSHYIHPSQLCIGLYVHLDLGWMSHPFTFSNFKIKDKEQIRQIRELSLDQIRYDPSRSDYEPLPLNAPTATPIAEKAAASAGTASPKAAPAAEAMLPTRAPWLRQDNEAAARRSGTAAGPFAGRTGCA